MRSIPPHQHTHPQQMQPQQMMSAQQPQPRTMQMVLVNTPQGMGWVPAQAMGQTAPPAPQPNPVASTFKTLLIVGGLSFAGWWAWKKWGPGIGGTEHGMGEPSRERHVKSRRRTRSRARVMSEFKHFLDDHGTGNLGEADEADECDYGFDGDHDDDHDDDHDFGSMKIED